MAQFDLCTRHINEAGPWLPLIEVGIRMCSRCARSAHSEGLVPDQERFVRERYELAGLLCPLTRNENGFAVFKPNVVEITDPEDST